MKKDLGISKKKKGGGGKKCPFPSYDSIRPEMQEKDLPKDIQINSIISIVIAKTEELAQDIQFIEHIAGVNLTEDGGDYPSELGTSVYGFSLYL